MNNLKIVHNIKKIAIKKINFRLSYFILLLIISFLSMTVFYSYAIFTVNKEKSGALNIIRSNLNYQITGNDITNNVVTVPKNSLTYLKVNIKNLNTIKTNYSLCYKDDLDNLISINYYLGTSNLPNSIVDEYIKEESNNKDIVLIINNSTDIDTNITLKVAGGLDGYDIVIPSGFNTINNGIGASGNIKDIVLNKQINNYDIDNSDSDYTYINGLNPNNYLWYSGKLWRVIGINKDNGSIKLITDDVISSIYYHNGASNISFSDSYANKFLNSTFYNSLRNPSNYLIDTSFNASAIDTNDKPNNSTLITKKIGLLNRYEYSKLNYLGNGKSFWLINPTTNNNATYINENNEVNSINATLGFGLRPVISLKNSLNIVDGIGSKANPYRLENDNDLVNDLKGEKLNTRYSGEYVKFNNQLFRIVNVIGNNTKIVSVNTIGEAIKFSLTEENNLYNEGNNAFNYLNNTWYNSLSLYEKSMIEMASFNTGLVSVGGNYSNASSSTINAKVGLPSVGELFAGYVGIDNKAYFTMTPNSNNTINRIDISSALANSSVISGEYNLKASLYLKDNVVIVFGNGTINNPFTFSNDAKEVTSNTKISTLLEDSTHLGSSGRYLNMENEKFILGENPNNYLWYSGKLWRVVSITTKTISEENKEDRYIKQVKLITDESITILPSYHKEYSTDFATSYAYNFLNEEFYSTLRNPSYYLDYTYLYNATLSTNNNLTNTTMIDCKVGLLNRYEYNKLTTDMDLNRNYLNINSSWWLINPYSSNNINHVTSSGVIDNNRSVNAKGIRPTIVLKGDILIVSGSGSYDSPYRLEGDNEKELSNDKLNTRYSGEYVNFNDELYRIVNIENSLTKLVSVDILSNNRYSYSIDSNWINSFSDNYSGNYLNNVWYNSLSQQSKDLISKSTWYLGSIKSGESYRCTKNKCTNGDIKTIDANTGLLRIGEIFNSYIGTNNKVDNRFFTLTTNDNNQVKTIGIDNSVLDESFNIKHGLRPAFYLKENVTIKSGTGIIDNPFNLKK